MATQSARPGASDPSRNEQLLTVDDLRALAKSGRELASELSVEVLLQTILDVAGRLTESPETAILLRNPREARLYFAAATGPDADRVLGNFGIASEEQVPIAGSKAGAVYQTRRSLLENVVSGHFAGVDDEIHSTTRSMVCVPLVVGSETQGVLQVLNKTEGGYTERDRVVLEFLADQAAVAIRNARLVERLVANSGLYATFGTTDELFARLDLVDREARSETLSVLFADMRGFSELCLSLDDPVLVQRRLGEFITMLSEAVLDEDGIVNRFLGDGLMALFQGEHCSERAVRSAFSMVGRFSAMKARWDAHSDVDLAFVDLGVGIATDRVILGGVGDGPLRDYTAIGTAVNLAAALEKAARNGKRILCDEATRRNAAGLVAGADAAEDLPLQKPGRESGLHCTYYALTSIRTSHPVRVFVSHSREDRGFVESLVARLEARGVQPWYPPTDVRQDALWKAATRKVLARCNWAVVIVSRHSAHSGSIRREVDLVLAARHLRDRVIPVVVDDADPRDVIGSIRTMQAICSTTTDDVPGALALRFAEATASDPTR